MVIYRIKSSQRSNFLALLELLSALSQVLHLVYSSFGSSVAKVHFNSRTVVLFRYLFNVHVWFFLIKKMINVHVESIIKPSQ